MEPRSQGLSWLTSNQQADYISRLIDTDDWQITKKVFLFLDGLWGPHSVDCFANYYNHKLPKYFSRFWNPNTSGVDFFFQSLRGENCLVVPQVGNLKNLRIVALCSLAFAGSFRYDELRNIVPKHIEFHSDYIRIFVPRSKTDVYREGNFVFNSVTRSKYCPVGVLQRYLDLSGIDLSSPLPLFRPLVFHRNSSSYILRSGKISYTTCRDILRDTLKSAGLQP